MPKTDIDRGTRVPTRCVCRPTALKVNKALVQDEYDELISKKRSEIEASFESTMSEL